MIKRIVLLGGSSALFSNKLIVQKTYTAYFTNEKPTIDGFVEQEI